jgi:hypothetical protein
MPARIDEKVRGRPKVWNTWNLLVSPTLTSPPAPEFVPCSESAVVAPVSVSMAALSRVLAKSGTKGRTVVGQEGKKEEKKERKNKRTRQKVNLQVKFALR